MAGKNRFLYDKVVRDGTLTPIVTTDYHPSYPTSNIQNIWTDYYYRTKYGNGSGWGHFEITASNRYIYFVDTGSTSRTATLDLDDYDADELATEIETQMEAQTTDTFTVTYSQTSKKFLITNDTGTFTLTCTNTTNATWDTIGYDTAANKTGSAGYTGDYVRIHSECGIEIANVNSTAFGITGCALVGLNLTSSYQIFKLQRWTGSAWADVTGGGFDYDSSRGCAIAMFNSVSQTKERILIRDWANSDYYVQIGGLICGDYEELSTWFDYGFSENIEDTSSHQYSKQGYLNVVTGFFKNLKGVTYNVMSADEAKLETVYEECGKRYPFVFVQDSDDPENTMEYCIFSGRLSRRGKDAYTKEITLAWEEVN
jgi:hypothetical protein